MKLIKVLKMRKLFKYLTIYNKYLYRRGGFEVEIELIKLNSINN
jgi:hypothetical protein